MTTHAFILTSLLIPNPHPLNSINDMTKATHKYEEVGKLIVTLRLDSGLDDDHQRLAVGQTDRHECEFAQSLFAPITGFRSLEFEPSRDERS